MAVFHIKYRPKKIAELDSEDVKVALRAVLSKEDKPQSFLFAGPKGAGKTSAARILAKAVNCLNPKNGDPCGECEACVAIEKGNATDIIEMDAASNRGIDEVRGLRDQAYLLPVRLKKKVFIIDEVHMMTKEAFNAMLKLVEEPPAHTMFVMCTTDPEKIPETVLSRLVRIDFKKGKKEEVLKSLQRSAKAEGIEIDEASMEMIFEKSEGSFRNAQRLLMEIYMEAGKEITIDKAQISQVLSKGGYSAQELEIDLKDSDVKKILNAIEQLADKGFDFGQLRREWIAYFQERMLSIYKDEKKTDGLKPTEIVKFLNLLISAGKLEKDATIDQLPLELAIIEFCEGKTSVGEQTTENKIQKTSSTQKPENKKQSLESKMETENEKMEEIVEVEEESGDEIVVNTSTTMVTVEEVERNWGILLQKVKPLNHSVEAFLRAARPVTIDKNRVVIEVYYPFHKDKLEEEKNRRIVEDQLNQIFKVNMLIECTLAKVKQKPIEIKNDTVLTEEKVEGKSDVKISEGEMYDIAKEIFG